MKSCYSGVFLNIMIVSCLLFLTNICYSQNNTAIPMPAPPPLSNPTCLKATTKTNASKNRQLVISAILLGVSLLVPRAYIPNADPHDIYKIISNNDNISTQDFEKIILNEQRGLIYTQFVRMLTAQLGLSNVATALPNAIEDTRNYYVKDSEWGLPQIFAKSMASNLASSESGGSMLLIRSALSLELLSNIYDDFNQDGPVFKRIFNSFVTVGFPFLVNRQRAFYGEREDLTLRYVWTFYPKYFTTLIFSLLQTGLLIGAQQYCDTRALEASTYINEFFWWFNIWALGSYTLPSWCASIAYGGLCSFGPWVKPYRGFYTAFSEYSATTQPFSYFYALYKFISYRCDDQ